MTSANVEFKEWTVWCEIFGSGETPLLMIPGLMGTWASDFYEQLCSEHALDLRKFTVVCIELPGWGRSLPRVRAKGKDFYENDAQACLKLMEFLGFEKYSVLGWCHGSTIALMVTQLNPSAVDKLVLVSVTIESESYFKNILSVTPEVKEWNSKIIHNFIRSYGNLAPVEQLWGQHLDFMRDNSKHNLGGSSDIDFDTINCPVLVIQGDKDPINKFESCLYVFNKLKNAHLERFPNGSHYFHHKYKREIKQIVENFLLE